MGAERVIACLDPGRIGRVLEIERRCFDDPWPESAFSAELAHAWSWFRAIGPGDGRGGLAEIEGFIVCWMMPLDMHLLKMAVLPECRRHGLARSMMEGAVRVFSAAGGGAASLEVRPSNRIAQRVYAAFSFEQVGVHKGYYERDDEDAIVMLRRIESARSESASG
jgi:ribosomal-protein-alanine N-acetyltransferase